MRTKNVGNEEIGGIVARRKREHAENGRLLAALERMQAEALLSAFCGSWIATEGTTSLLVRREAEGYGLLLCDNTHCYKSIVADLRAEARGRRLLLEDGARRRSRPTGCCTADATARSAPRRNCCARSCNTKWTSH